VTSQGYGWTSPKKFVTTEKLLYVLKHTNIIVSTNWRVAKYRGTSSAYSFGNEKLL